MQQTLLRPVIAVALATALTGCLFQDPVEAYGGPTMGSTYSVKYVRSAGAAAPEQLKRETDGILSELDAQLSTYRPDSLIEQFNASPAGTCLPMPAPVLQLVAAGEAMAEESQGALDLTVGPLLDLWGFGPRSKGEQVPSAEEIAETRRRVGYQHLLIEGDELCKTVDLQVDFNAIAAGYAVDRVAQHLEASGVSSYLVEITGELKAKGKKPDGSAWRIAIEAPREGERTAQTIIELDGYSISTSGDYRNYYERDGKRYSHTVDPATARPIEHRLASVTVADRSALRADGLSTMLMVFGPERGMEFAERQGIPAFFVIRENQEFVTTRTEAFERLFGAGDKQ